MAAKTLTQRKRVKVGRNVMYGRRLISLVEEHQALSKRLLDFLEELEDERDHRIIEAAKKKNAGKPGIPWEEAKKKLGLKFD